MANTRTVLPRSLYGRAALILIVPILTIQLVFALQFIQRHYEGVTRQMASGVEIELSYLLNEIARAPDATAASARAIEIGQGLDFDIIFPAPMPVEGDHRDFWDLSGRALISALREGLPEIDGIDLQTDRRAVVIGLQTARGPLEVDVDRRRMSASNPHQLLVLMIVTSLLMTVIAYLFLSNQLRPIAKLAQAADAFGKGRHVAYRPRGALEVRAAGAAFLEMRNRIERQIEQRTLMLSGVSHDLRTPLTRMKLELAMMDEDDARDLLRDVQDMERLVDEFLAFSRGDAMEAVEPVDPVAIVRRAVENAQRMGQDVTLGALVDPGDVPLRPQAVARALDNLIGNAVRYGKRAEVSLALTDRNIRFTVEDDGPGIPKERREEAMRPFTRLESERNPNKGGGVGLGLSIAADIARSHGGQLRLGESETLGGLKAEIVLAR